MARETKLRDRPRLQRKGARIAAVVSRFHTELTEPMLVSAKRELAASGVKDGDVRTIWVPGSFELPLVARALAERKDVDAVICIGIILRGETDHDIYIAEGAVQGLMETMLGTGKPLLLGILTCETLAQARARALPPEMGGVEDKGREVARSAIETLAALDEARARGAARGDARSKGSARR